ncbi:hypothetical protein O71_18266 [Pontibacter sp. BAB1700]|nr:hypothetical protein O71_18266 [Pontibacter sp. BAB1700]
MIEVDKLFKRGYCKFPYTLSGKAYNITLYLQDEYKGFCHAAINKADLHETFPLFLDTLIIKNEFEVYHVLLLVGSTYHPLYMRVYNIQVEIKVPGFKLPQFIV